VAEKTFSASVMALFPANNQPFAILESTLILSKWQIGNPPFEVPQIHPTELQIN
jgi:hypothetical protein